MNRLSPLALAAALVATGLSVVGAAPAPAKAPKSVAVSYRDLDLTTSTGRRTLDRRLSRAASAVCPVVSRDLSAASACAYGAYAQAKDDLRLAVQGGGIRVAR